MEELESILTAHDIRPTAMRLLILRTMKEMERAVSLGDLEARLATAEKSTIFRTLTLFLSQHLVHTIEDGSGQTKYALDEDADAEHDDLHTHFYCEQCGHTFCLPELPIPEVTLPDGFRLHSANYVLKGLCPKCASRSRSTSGA